MFEELRFQYEFRKYQQMMLARVEGGPGDRRHHLVAPPGSGKTIVGLELIRSFAQHWKRYVGGRELVYTRKDPDRQILLAARTQVDAC